MRQLRQLALWFITAGGVALGGAGCGGSDDGAAAPEEATRAHALSGPVGLAPNSPLRGAGG